MNATYSLSINTTMARTRMMIALLAQTSTLLLLIFLGHSLWHVLPNDSYLVTAPHFLIYCLLPVWLHFFIGTLALLLMTLRQWWRQHSWTL